MGTVAQRGCAISLQDSRSDRRLVASLDSCAHRGSASLQVFARGTTLTISAEGPDEAHAVQSLIELVQSGFGEESWNA